MPCEWKNSKRLLFYSLLVITNSILGDVSLTLNFMKTVYCIFKSVYVQYSFYLLSIIVTIEPSF